MFEKFCLGIGLSISKVYFLLISDLPAEFYFFQLFFRLFLPLLHKTIFEIYTKIFALVLLVVQCQICKLFLRIDNYPLSVQICQMALLSCKSHFHILQGLRYFPNYLIQLYLDRFQRRIHSMLFICDQALFHCCRLVCLLRRYATTLVDCQNF